MEFVDGWPPVMGLPVDLCRMNGPGWLSGTYLTRLYVVTGGESMCHSGTLHTDKQDLGGWSWESFGRTYCGTGVIPEITVSKRERQWEMDDRPVRRQRSERRPTVPVGRRGYLDTHCLPQTLKDTKQYVGEDV